MAQQSQGPPKAGAPANQLSTLYGQGGQAQPIAAQGGVYNMGPMQAGPGAATGQNWLTGPPGATAKGTSASPSWAVLQNMFQIKQQKNTANPGNMYGK